MDSNKLSDRTKNITTSRKGISYEYTSPVPGVHIYDNVWDGGMDFMRMLDSEGKFVREDYKFDAEGKPVPPEVGKQGVSTWIKDSTPERDDLLCDVFGDIVDSYLWHYDLDPRSREWWRISKFKVGDYFGMHPDDSFGTPRTVSMVYYPNDGYEGGELDFIHFGVKFKPKAGQLVLFPSSYIYEHRVGEIGAGEERYTIVAFFCNITEEERTARLAKLPTPYSAKLQDIKTLNERS